MTLQGNNIIAGSPTAVGPAQFRAIDPTTGHELDPPFHEAIEAQVDQAMHAADQAFKDYRRRPPADRARFLHEIATQIESLGEDLIDRANRETALGVERLRGERGRTIGQLRMFADLIEEGSWVDARIDHAIPDRKPLPKPDLRRMRIPVGPVVVFGASNFPLAFSVAGGDTASALAAGCPVIVKAHPAHPGTSEMVASAIVAAAEKNGMPGGVFSLLHGRSPDLSLALVRHPLTAAVGFTGSLKAGRALFNAAAARPNPIPVFAEMGSVNPVFLLPGALAGRGEQIAQGLKQSVTLGVGQFCTKPGVVVGIDHDATRRFVATASELMKTASHGAMLHAGIHTSYLAGVKQTSSIPGVTVASATPSASGQQVIPALFATDGNTFLAHERLAEELFGPSAVFVTASSREQMMQIARELEGHLTATIHGTPDDLREFADLVDVLHQKVGRLIFNGFPTGVEVCPSMQHGGPYPATTDARTTSVGTAAIERFVRPICFQNFPQDALPPELRDDNPLKIWRLVDGQFLR
ncbi:MAG TPA: aldehyde dehydrogenase (NADP(+)) [Tepidisphaeraceae bacterium]|jgi:NADP-dependent aldehyde dehydrogenase